MTNELYLKRDDVLNLFEKYQPRLAIRVYEFGEALKDLKFRTLESQPCENTISRESVIEWLKDKDIIKTKNQEENARRELSELPSVTPSYNSVKTELKPCEDCISREAVVNWLEVCTDDSIEHAIESNLEFIPSVTPKALEQTRWTLVSKELPKNEQKVLFCTKQGNVHQGIYYEVHRWYSCIRSTWIYFDSILAWTPLPESYEEGEK